MNDKITQDIGVNLVRQLRTESNTYLDALGTYMIDTRNTMKAQATRIGELEATEDELSIQCNTDAVRIAELKEELETSNMAIESLQDMCNDHERDAKELTRLNSVMFLRLEAHATARYQGVTITGRQAEWMGDTIRQAALAHGKQVRVNRIATAIRDRIKDGHPAIAIQLCAALMEETHDKHNGDTEAHDGPRSNNDGPDIRGFGQASTYPYA